MADSIVRLRVESQEFESKLKRASQELLAMAENARRTQLARHFRATGIGGGCRTSVGTHRQGTCEDDEREMSYTEFTRNSYGINFVYYV